MDDLKEAAKSLVEESSAVVEALRAKEAREILDRIGEAPDDVFVDLASIAAQICGVPLAAVSLIDDDRAYLKGLHWDTGSWSDCARSDVVCNVTIKTPDQPLIIYDAEVDERVCGLPFVNGTYDYIRFHAGLPLVTKKGNAVGTICVFDRMPRILRKDQLAAMERLRRLVLRLYGA